jgi:alpha-L-arabinofuranosidase
VSSLHVLKPLFLRFPGGAFVEGVDLNTSVK